MATDPEQALATDQQAWHELEESIAEISRLAKSDIPLKSFATELLDRTVHMLGAVGGAVWIVDASETLRLECQISLDALYAAVAPSCQNFHVDLLDQALHHGEAQVIAPHSPHGGAQLLANPTDYLLIICPLKIDQDVAGLVEVIQRPAVNPTALRGNRRLVSMVCDLAADFLKRREIKGLRQREFQSFQFEEFVQQVHGTLEPRGAAYQVVNEGRRYIGCDRVSVAICRGQTFQMLATSGVDTIHRRSNVIRRLEDMAATIALAGEPLWYGGESADLPPQVEEPIRLYVDQAHAKAIGLIPLRVSSVGDAEQGVIVGVLVAEQFADGFDDQMQRRVMSVANQGGQALKNALDFQALPTLPFLRSRWRASYARSRSLPRGVVALLAGTLVAALLILVPADFDIHARGVLQPRQRRDVFAPLDGEIVEVAVRHGEDVTTGDLLLVLRSPEIDLERQRLQGEFATTRQRLLAVESALLQAHPSEVYVDTRPGQLATERAELKLQLDSQQRQIELLREQIGKLEVRSPIDGRVLTWDLSQLLENRPVQRGQALMAVANMGGPWIADLQVPDDRIGFVLGAQKEQDAALAVSFELATEHGVVYRGSVSQIASRTELTDEHQPIVKVTVDLQESMPGLRPGTTVYARIACGRKSIGYVWLHDLVDAVRSWLLF